METINYENDDVVRRLMKEEGLGEEEARGAFRDLLRFLYVASSSPRPLAPPPRIDLAWHTFLMFTAEYRRFCVAQFGRFLDHLPHAEGAEADPELVPRTIAIATGAFGALSSNWDFAYGLASTASTTGCAFSDCTPCSGTTNCQG